jgi:ketosteroid isomerase-like protein
MAEHAKKLIHLYIDGWKENNEEKIISVLSDDCIIIESHGPRYKGKQQVRDWVTVWKEMKGKVLSWDIVSFYYDEEKYAHRFSGTFIVS